MRVSGEARGPMCRLPVLVLTTLHVTRCRLGDGARRRREGRGANCKFYVMLSADSTCHVTSKGQTKECGPTVNHLKSLWTRKLNLNIKRRGVDLR